MNKHGGKRKGAGGGKPKLPPGKKKMPYSTRLSPYIIKWLKGQDKAAQKIEQALKRTYGI